MPPLEIIGRHQPAVLWECVGYDAQGEPKVTDVGVDLLVRWDRKGREIRDPKGNLVMLDAMAVVDRFIPYDSIMALGTLADWGEVGTANTSEVGELMIVKSFSEIPDVKGRDYYREVGLKRWRDLLPTQE